MSRARKRTSARRGFFILDGVRRALAAREAGRKTVPAIVFREGQAPELRPRMPLASLYSPKDAVTYDLRFLQIVPPIDEPIKVEPLGARAQPRSVRLAAVRLV